MPYAPTKAESETLHSIWQDQGKATGPPVDFANPVLPAPPAQGVTADEAAQALADALGWPQWVRLFAQPPRAILAASKLARQYGRPAGVLWVAPGAGAPFDPPKGQPGVCVLRADWAKDADSVRQAADDARRQGLLLLVDESHTGLRLGQGGAAEYYGLEPDAVLYAPPLPSGQKMAALAGRGPAPDQKSPAPQAQVLAEAAGLWRWAGPWLPERLAQLSRSLSVGLDYYKRYARLDDEIALEPEAPAQMPRLAGRRLWAFMELAAEEGLYLGPQVMPDPRLEPEEMQTLVWPRLARACARLHSLPEGAKAPLGWKDAGQVSCRRIEDILGSIETPA